MAGDSMSDYTREIKFDPAFDKRDPNPSKDYGVHGLHIWFYLRHLPTKTGLTFSISTNWQLPHVQAEQDAKPFNPRFPYLFYKPQAFGVDFHGQTPMYEGQTPMEKCDITGGKCYCDGSAILGEEFLQILISQGDEALWKRMEEQHIYWSPKNDG